MPKKEKFEEENFLLRAVSKLVRTSSVKAPLSFASGSNENLLLVHSLLNSLWSVGEKKLVAFETRKKTRVEKEKKRKKVEKIESNVVKWIKRKNAM